MQVLIIEDEPATANRLVRLLTEVAPETQVIEVIDTVEESVDWFNSHTSPQLVFMDIHLADGNSFEIFDKAEVHCPVIFTTAYDQYAIRAFKVNSIDYLLKPIKREELVRALNKFRQTGTRPGENLPDLSGLARLLEQKSDDHLKRFMVRTGQQIRAVDIADVAYFYVENKIVTAVSAHGQRFLADFTMDYLEKHLDPVRFFRVNRSFIISFTSIDTMVAYSKSRIRIELKPACDLEVISSSERTAAFKSWLMGNRS